MYHLARARIVGFLTVISSAAAFTAASPARATNANLPLVFDPQTQKYFIGGSSQFVLRQADESLIDRIEVSIDGGDYQPYSDSIQFKTEGKHSLKFRAFNSANGSSAVQFVEVIVDLTPPTSEAKLPDGKSFQTESVAYVSPDATITLSAHDSLSGVASLEYSWDGGGSFLPYKDPIKIERPGRQTLLYRSIDRVGNIEETRKLELVADNTAPVTTVRFEGKSRPALVSGKTFVSDTLAFALDAQDDLSQVGQILVSIDGKKEEPYLRPIYFLQEGPHTLSYYAVDRVGNREKPRTMAIYSISTPPRTRIVPIGRIVNTGGINYATQDLKVKLQAEENAVGLDRIEYRMGDSGDFQTYIEPLRFPGPGKYVVSYRAVDRAGNIEPARVFPVTIHLQAPETTIATAQPVIQRGGQQYSPAPNVITFNVSNSAVGVDKTLVSVNDGPFAKYAGPITLNSDRRVQKITYKSIDKLGNEEQPKTVIYNMIGVVPIVDLFVTNGKSSEEQIRTKYLDQPGGNGPVPGEKAAGEKPSRAVRTRKLASPEAAQAAPVTAPAPATAEPAAPADISAH